MLRLDNKVALVTGCGSLGEGWGNGQAIAVLLARQGAQVFGTDLNEAAGQRTADIIRQEGGSVDVVVSDSTDPAQVEAAVAACLARHGRIDILINNVGRSEPGGPVELTEQAWEDQLSVNVTSAFLACKHVLPIMEKQGGGSVVSISSIAGLRYAGKPQVGYAAAKAALMQFTRTTAVMYAPKGIRLNCVVPGLVFTPLVKRLADKYAGGDFDGFVAHRHRQVPMGHMGDAWDVAHTALFLAADESKYITAQEIVVDGGITAATR
ncbi:MULTISPECIES: SDR family NAD(P)-dependent oxidoreductase [unclassified Bordetella]|uniref:SDR family NAD(P)-dependent oxidoreductase n=1 Tax=unclassified Bordetella TaxID=2630031 RepID=UPI00132464CB|nr:MULTISPECIES: SDR family NAD(P)-dependent oxidoreductase [unclassified Bordetella]MVW72753.1 SDR family oxidoreductase [Bordetella sp. 15P40C-2]MVW77682.1 SDR family oxidoreductase [Bordetella sp. 02P26C-1]